MWKRRKLLLVLAGWGMCLTALTAWFIRPREPQYQGHPLSYWLGADTSVATLSDSAARDALHHCGPEVLPCLITLISREPPAWELPLRRAMQNCSSPAWTRWRQTRTQRTDAQVAAGLYGFDILGEAASPAIPELGRLAVAPCREMRSYRAIEALCFIGPRSVPTLLSVATNRSAQHRSTAIWRLSDFGTNSLIALPILLDYLSDPDPGFALIAMNVLGTLQLAPDLVVPALGKVLLAADPERRMVAAHALAKFGPTAIPTLRAALDDPIPAVHEAVSNALYSITLAPTNTPAQ